MKKHSIQIILLHLLWNWTPKSANVVICIWRNYKDKERAIIIKGDFGVGVIMFREKKSREDCRIRKNIKIENKEILFSQGRGRNGDLLYHWNDSPWIGTMDMKQFFISNTRISMSIFMLGTFSSIDLMSPLLSLDHLFPLLYRTHNFLLELVVLNFVFVNDYHIINKMTCLAYVSRLLQLLHIKTKPYVMPIHHLFKLDKLMRSFPRYANPNKRVESIVNE